ncbi:response regulator [bacterium]|nr:response regulator [bacterium]
MNDRKTPLILTIDDEKYIRDSFRSLLEDHEYQVLEAENGRIGLELFENEKPDLILVDMRMPVVDGLEVLEKVTSASPDTPIIVISGAGEIKDAVKALRLGAWDYLMKPITDLDMLAHTIERALERRRLIRENKEYQEHLEEKVAEQTKNLAQAHQELQKSEKQYRTIVETAREGIWITDKQNRIQFATEQSAKMFGYTIEDMKNIELASLVDPVFFDKFMDYTDKFFNGESSQFDMKFIRKDGSELWGIVSSSPIMDESGSIQSSFTMIMDITDRKKAEEELARHKDHLEELVRERTEELERTHKELVEKAHKAGMADIATDIVHNIGNVLNSVKTSVQIIDNVVNNSLMINFKKANELLRENIDSLEEFICKDEKGKLLMNYYLKIEEGLDEEQLQVKELIERMRRMVDAIADIVSAQQSYTTFDWLVEEADLRKTVSDAITVMNQQIEAFHIDLKLDFAEVPPVPIQRIKLLHVLINIIKNAGEAMASVPNHERSFSISVGYDPIDSKTILIRLKDNGPGISPENLERIFSYGFTTKKGRHGLGLHSCANYITEMGGKIWAENNSSGKGTTFFLKFRIPDKTEPTSI